jgi:hypothetical protein
MHAAKLSVPTPGGKKEGRKTAVTIYSFTSVMEGAMTTIYDKLDSIATAYDEKLYVSAFVTNFSAFLKSQWNVELELLSETNSASKSDHIRDNNTGNVKQLQLRGDPREIKSATDYLGTVVSALLRHEKKIDADTSFKFKELLNFQKRIHAEHPRNSDSAAAAVDPLDGALPLVVLEMRPPMDPRGFQYMKFPVQVTCLCLAHANHRFKFAKIIDELTRIEQEFYHQSVSYSNHLVLQQLTDKVWRTSLTLYSQISGVLWDQNTGNASVYPCTS